MNRFQLMKQQEPAKPIAYQFQRTGNAAKVLEYIKRCIQDGVAFDANNIYSSVVDQALFLLHKEQKIPIITKTEKTTRLLMATNNFQEVYTVNNIPDKLVRVICYWDLNPKEIPQIYEIALTISRKNENHK
jgi:hypothetical protein